MNRLNPKLQAGNTAGCRQQILVPLKPCMIFSIVLLVPTMILVLWLSQNGLNRTLYWTQQVDWFIQLNQYFSLRPRLWLNLTQLGDALVLLPLLSFFIIASPRIWAALLGAIPVAATLIHGGKMLVVVPRPAAVLDTHIIHIVGEPLMGHNSLPSGHSATVFVAGTIIMLCLFFSQPCRIRWWTLLVLLTITTILSLSRVAVGAHWPLDIFFGAVCGYFGGLSGVALVQQYTRWWVWLKHPEYLFIPGLILLVWSVSLLPVFHSKQPEPTIVLYLASLMGITVALHMLIRRFVMTTFRFKEASLRIKYPTIAVSWSRREFL